MIFQATFRIPELVGIQEFISVGGGSITVGKKAALLGFNPLTHSIEEV